MFANLPAPFINFLKKAINNFFNHLKQLCHNTLSYFAASRITYKFKET